ncbi:MAG: KilA-N domain-containing protein [Bacteroidaceae bacterium]|nr:KilA-N domain-containing protein [Bacteroidaceae bacterium]
MAKKNEVIVKDTVVRTMKKGEVDFISLTDIAKQKNAIDPNGVIANWMRNRNTIEFLGIWETLYNPNFNPLEFEGIRKEAGLNAFTMSPTRWIELTNAMGVVSQADVLNVAMFGMTAREWREKNPERKGNIRDYASINELICLSNMENLNAVFIDQGMSQSERLVKLNRIAIQQMSVLENEGGRRLLK